MMFFKYVVVVNLYVFYGSLSRPSAVQTARTRQKMLVTKHVRTKSILPVAKLKHALSEQDCLNLIYFCRKYTIFPKFYEFMLQKVLKFANYAVAVLV